jgi:hypothetical protein
MTTTHFATLVGAAAAVAAIAAAPVAEANQAKQSCQSTGQSLTVCQSPGDVEINDAPPPVTFYPYGSPPPTAG